LVLPVHFSFSKPSRYPIRQFSKNLFWTGVVAGAIRIGYDKPPARNS
jgi:hypothetical protein